MIVEREVSGGKLIGQYGPMFRAFCSESDSEGRALFGLKNGRSSPDTVGNGHTVRDAAGIGCGGIESVHNQLKPLHVRMGFQIDFCCAAISAWAPCSAEAVGNEV